ncbi:hypothetical protein ACQJBY_040749 [Aegilops geniculata]
MGVEEQDVQQPDGGGKPDAAAKSPTPEHGQQKPSNPRVLTCSTDKDDGLALCRVCHCVEPDLRGESALGFLGIVPPSPAPSADKDPSNGTTKTSTSKDAPTFLEFISPEGEIFKCATDIESGHLQRQDDVVNLGCSCKNELALALRVRAQVVHQPRVDRVRDLRKCRYKREARGFQHGARLLEGLRSSEGKDVHRGSVLLALQGGCVRRPGRPRRSTETAAL